MNVPEDFKNKILHARFIFGKFTMFASDMMPKKIYEALEVMFPFHLDSKNEVLAKIFSTGYLGGEINIPFKKQFWGDWHGNFSDRFGIH